MSRTSRANKLTAVTSLTHQQAVQHLVQLGLGPQDEKRYVLDVVAQAAKGAVGVKKCLMCSRNVIALTTTPHPTCPICTEHEDEPEDTIWDDDAKASVRHALEEADWDFAAKTVTLPDTDVRGRASSIEFDKYDDFHRHLVELAFDGYNQTAPREDGDWVFPFEGDDLVEQVLEDGYSDKLVSMGWW